MPSSDRRPPLIVLLGSTAVGKTEAAIALAKRVEGEIVSADSRLFYRGMDIGTAKPSAEARARVRHHLIDVADPDETWSLAVFQDAAGEAIAEIHARGKLPILVGGTGQYLRAVTEGWEVPKQAPNWPLREALERWTEEVGEEGLHRRLAVVDKGAAAKIDARNRRRTIRALEVILSSGRRFSEQRKRGQPEYRVLQLGLWRTREELYQRIDARIEAMFDAGLVEEVEGLLEKYASDLPCFSAIGYRQVIDYLEGHISLEEAVMVMKRLTRQFVRRQANWFKQDDPAIGWVQVDGGSVDALEGKVRVFLRGEKWRNYL